MKVLRQANIKPSGILVMGSTVYRVFYMVDEFDAWGFEVETDGDRC